MVKIGLNRIAILGLIGIVLGLLGTSTFVDPDVFHSMALFRSALALGHIPTEDTFSYVPTVSPMIHHEWGTGALLYLLTVSAGLGATGLMALKYLISAGIVIGCYLYAKREGASVAVFAPLAVVASILGSIGFTTIRAHLFSLLFLVILLLFLQEDRHGKRWWIAVWLPLQIVWINLHAGFVLGLGLIGFYTLERLLAEIVALRPPLEALRRVQYLIGVGLAMAGLIVLNPYGLSYIPHLWHALTLNRALITEWRPIWDSGHEYTWCYRMLFLGLCIILLSYSLFRLGFRATPHLFFLAATAWLSIFHVRYLSVFTVTWICCVPAYIEKTNFGQVLRRLWVNKSRFLLVFWMTYGGVGLAVAVQRQFWRLSIPTTVTEHEKKGFPIYPVGAVDYLADQNFEGNLMVPFTAGAYVSWRLDPAVKVSLDSRFEAAYSIEWTEEQVRFYQGQDGWQKTLNRYPTDAVLVPRHRRIEKLLAETAEVPDPALAHEWSRVYKDDGFSIFMRSEIAERFEIVDNTGKKIIGSFP